MKAAGASASIRYFPRARLNRRSCALASIGPIVAAVLLRLISPSSSADATTLPPSMAVTAVKSTRACFSDTLVVMGAVVPQTEILVRPDREGLQIAEILVEVGQKVSSAQVLARLAPPHNQQGATVSISAPTGGIVIAAPTVVGEMVSTRAEALFRIIADDDLELSAEIPAKQASRLAPGQTAKVNVAGLRMYPAVCGSSPRPSTRRRNLDTSAFHSSVIQSAGRCFRAGDYRGGRKLRCRGSAVGAAVRVGRANRARDPRRIELRPGASQSGFWTKPLLKFVMVLPKAI